MAITFVAAGTAVSSAGGATGSLSPPLPAGVQSGDLLLIFVSGRNTGYVFSCTGYSKKWDPELDHSSSGINTIGLFWKIHSGSESNPTVSWTGGATNATVIMQMCAFRGVNQTTPFDVQGATSSNGDLQNIGPISGITTGVNGKCVIVFGHRSDDWTSVDTLTGDGLTWYEIGEPDSTSGSDAGMVWDYAISASGSITITAKTFTVTGGTTDYGLGVMLSLNEAVAQVHEIELFEPAISFSDALTRQPSRPLSESAVSILAETLARAVQRQLSEASISIPTETLTRLVSRALSEPSLSFTDAVEKSVQRNISLNEAVVSIVAETLAREVRRTLSEAAVSIPAETLIRFISRALSEPSISFSDFLARQVLRSLAEPTVSIPAETLTRLVERVLSESTLLFSDSLIRMVSFSLSEISLSFSDSVTIEVIPGGPPPPTGKGWRVHVPPVTHVHTPKVM